MLLYNMLGLIFLSILLEVTNTVNCSKFSFASSYGDHMVLQKSPQQATVWGYASHVSETVTVQLSGKGSVTTKTRHGDSPGVFVWSVLLPAVGAGGPYTITASSSEGKITLSDVLFGDVWVCSGQSNMQFTMNMAFNSTAEIADADNYPHIRLFTATQKSSAKPLLDFLELHEPWAISSSKSVGGKTWIYFSALCFMYGKHLYNTLQYPIGLVSTSYGGTIDEAWSSPDALDKCYHKDEIPALKHKTDGSVDPNSFSVLWNAMAKPLLNMTIYGAIWYQGESNSNPNSGLYKYNCTFPAMIEDWRAKFSEGSGGQTSDMFPFGFVQLAGFRKGNIPSDWSLLRWHQTADFGYVPNDRMQNVFMAVAMDLPDFTSNWGSIHPRDKQDIAERLYTEALVVAYNQTDKASLRGPFPSGFTVVVGGNDDVVITFDLQKSTIEKRSNDGFEVCCLPRRDVPDPGVYCSYKYPASEWIAAPITASDSHSVTIHYGNVCTQSNPYIGGVRYAWKESPCNLKQCAIYNKLSGYPAAPFIHFITV